MRRLFHLEGLVEAGLEHIVNKGIGDPGLVIFYHYRHLQGQRFAVDDGSGRARLHFDEGPIFADGVDLGVVVPFHISTKLGQGFIQLDHMRCASVRQRLA